MNGQEFVLILIAMVFVFSIVKHKMGIPSRSIREMRGDPEVAPETLRLRDEVSQLKERLKVLERIAVEKEDSLSKEIESLRDR